MTISTEALIENLSDQVELHAVLLEALETESDLPASCTIEKLEDLHSVRDMAVQNIANLEKSRIAITENYQKSLQLKHSLTLTAIIEQSSETDQVQLKTLRGKLKEQMGSIQQFGKTIANKAVARMACFNEIQGNMHKTFKRIPTYSMKGVLSRPKGAYFVKRSI